MPHLSLEVPSMYGDHHVTEVRGLLAAIAGVSEIIASSAWQRVELTYDPAQTSPEAIEAALVARGYGRDGHLPPVSPRTKTITDYVVGPSSVEEFVEHVPAWSGGLSPCPGFEVLHPGDVHPADLAAARGA